MSIRLPQFDDFNNWRRVKDLLIVQYYKNKKFVKIENIFRNELQREYFVLFSFGTSFGRKFLYHIFLSFYHLQRSNISLKISNKLTSWSRALIEKLTVTQLPPFMEREGSLPCSQGHATGPYPEQDEFS
jgi:hypothetical protein